jgi:hypothetical protein
MFNCGVCHKASEPGESATRVVTETRTKVYPKRLNAHSNGNDDPGGVGNETVKEIMVCKRCQ